MKQWYLIIAVVAAISFITACSSEEPIVDNTRVGLSTAELVVSEDMGEFNTDIFKALVAQEDKNENLIISPLSAAMYLSMQANYCSENTQSQIFKALGSSNIDALNSFNAKMLASLGSLDKSTTLTLANSVWYDHKYSLKAAAKENLSNHFSTEFFPCDHNKPETKILVNNWIKENTEGKITQFNDGKPFDSMVLNAMYFNSEWKDKFSERNTTKEKFHVGEKIYMVDMMKRLDGYEYLYGGENFTACRREFGNGAFTCTFILPDEGCDINDYIANLSYEDLADIEFNKVKCDLFVPKFELSKTIDDCINIFASLGIYGLDTPLDVDSKNMTIQVKQESYIKLDENGAEVAATTGDKVVLSPLDPNKHRFELNRSFIFMINETSTNACILTGRISKFK